MILAAIGISLAKAIPEKACRFRSASREETLNELSTSSKSLIRWGDGETGLLLFQSLDFQRWDARLWAGLFAVFVDGLLTNRFIFAIPFASLQERIQMDKLELWAQWFPTRILFASAGYLFPRVRKKLLHESHLFRGHEGFEDWTLEDPRPFFIGKEIAYVGNRAGFHRFLIASGAIDVKHVDFPEKEGFAAYKSTLDQCKRLVEEGSEVLVLACGPTAKLLARKLSRRVRILDLGHWQDYAVIEEV
jgi:hypothetical protein